MLVCVSHMYVMVCMCALKCVCMCLCVWCGDKLIETQLLRVILCYSNLTVSMDTDMPGFPGLPLVTHNDEFYVYFLSSSAINTCPHS